jgi:hypothetical protein
MSKQNYVGFATDDGSTLRNYRDNVIRMDPEFKEPWTGVGEYARNLSNELEREVTEGHLLWKKRSRAIAQRTDCDDVLFVIEQDGDVPVYAVVHLTWSGGPGSDAHWPDTEIYCSLEEWSRNRMAPDHDEFMTP